MNKYQLLALAFSGVIFSSSSLLAGEISYVGSSTVGKFVKEAAQVYTASSFKINTKPESGGGENATAAGKADIGGVAREVKQMILDRGVNRYLIGKDAIGILVNTANPVDSLSLAQLKDIFSGKITNWKQVGGQDIAIKVYVVNPQSATRKVFAKVVLGGEAYGGNIETVRPDPKIAEKVAADKAGIGQLSFALIGSDTPVKKIKPDGQAASVDNSSYPITRPLYLITKGPASGDAKDFIDWSLSADGQAVVKRYFVGK